MTTLGLVEVRNEAGLNVRVRLKVRRDAVGGYWATVKVGKVGRVACLATQGAALAWAFAEAQSMVERG